MRAHTLTHLSDAALLRDLAALVARDRATTAALLAHIAEVDARRLYLPAGHASMHAYCVDELHLSDGATYKRIQVARAARQFPVLLVALAEGRVHLSGLLLLAPHLTLENVDELVGTATHRRKSEIEQFLAVRASAPERPASVRVIPTAAPGQSSPRAKSQIAFGLALNPDEQAPGLVESPPVHENGAPPPERYALSVTIAKSTHDKLRHAQALLSHAIPSGDIAQVLDRALDSLIEKLERRKFAATSKPRTPRPKSQQPAGTRSIPAQVKRAVWQRDRGRCTFVGENGHRCAARRFLEFDHVDPVARGGKATVQGVRLRCRGHNQLEAERAFGARFMDARREEARRVVAEARSAAEARAAANAAAAASTAEQTRAIIPGLHWVVCRADEARRAAEHAAGACDGGTLEEVLRTGPLLWASNSPAS